jgi:putative molybdopterin biosynthesis protein
MHKPSTDPLLLTLPEVAEILRVNENRAADLARRGLIPIVRLGRQIRVSRAQLDQFVASGGRALPGGWKRQAEPNQAA